MKKITSRQENIIKQYIKEKRASYKKSRTDKEYISILKKPRVNSFINQDDRRGKGKPKDLVIPKTFCFITNTVESLKFFHEYFKYINQNYTKFNFIMTDVEDLGIETLLYIISLDKIYKAQNKKIKITLSMPKSEDIKFKLTYSGFREYFTGKKNPDFIKNSENIFTICDGASNKEKKKQDAKTCAEAVDFVKKFINKDRHKEQIFRDLYCSLVELMQNTEDHAYRKLKKTNNQQLSNPENIMRNWYLFAVKLKDNKIAFYFFDNGEGITKTAKRTLFEKAIETISNSPIDILQSTFNGEFRSATGLKNRNKGLPQINNLLKHNDILLSIVLTNKVFNFYENKNNIFNNIKYNFKGSLFVWILPCDK